MSLVDLLHREADLSTIAFPVISSPKKGYPTEAGAHIALRMLSLISSSLMLGTIRRFLEHWGDTVTRIVLVFDKPNELKTYLNILPLYFPRNRCVTLSSL